MSTGYRRFTTWWKPATIPVSSMRVQNGSNSASAIERGPPKPCTGAELRYTIRAPRSATHSSSSTARPTCASGIIGVGKTAFS